MFPSNYEYFKPIAVKPINLGNVSAEEADSIANKIIDAWDIEANRIIREYEESKSKKSFGGQLKSDFTNAAYRVGANQLLTMTKNMIVNYTRNHCNEEGKIRAMSDLLDTDIGKAVMGMFVGYVISQIPQADNNPKVARILKEFRVAGLTVIGNSAFESILSGVMVPALTSAFQTIDESEKNTVPSLEEQISNEETNKTTNIISVK